MDGAGDLNGDVLRLVGLPNLRSRRFAFRQFDSTVQGNTVFGPGAAAAAVIRVDGTCQGLALTTDCTPRLMLLDPRRGAQQAVAEATRNLACVGATPIAVTDCLNFGNPEKPFVAWQLTEAVHGLAEACRALDVPIVSGNVSLYNETAGRPIPPTPAIGMVGLLEDVTMAVPLAFQPDCEIVFLGQLPESLAASEYLPQHSTFPRFDLAAERRLGELLRDLAARRLLRSAQDINDGGLAIALVECALAEDVGATVTLPSDPYVSLFSEDQACAVITCPPSDLTAVAALAGQHHVDVLAIGRTGGDRLVVGTVVDLSLASLHAAADGAQT